MINNEVDTTTGSILLRAQFPNTDELLWPGQFVNVMLVLRTLKDAVLVPSQAVQLSQQGPFVFVVKSDMTVESRLVTSGVAHGSDVVITKGLAPQERVVTSGQLRLVPGAKVEVKVEGTGAKKKPDA
jgi:multidrug efflux system membrane fusion protein